MAQGLWWGCRRPEAECLRLMETPWKMISFASSIPVCWKQGYYEVHAKPLETSGAGVICVSQLLLERVASLPSSGFADLALWTIAKHKASSPWPWPTHLLGVGDDLFVPQLSWKN